MTVEQPGTGVRMSLHDDVRRLVEGFSIEVVPREARRIDDFQRHLPSGTRVFVAWIPGARPRDVADTAVKLREHGMVPVPHLPARNIDGKRTLRNLLGQLAGEAEVDEALVIGGDSSRQAGPFASSLDLLQTGLLEDHGIRRVGIAGHPEGHPSVGESMMRQALRAKAAYAAANEVEMRIVTQFAFSARPILRWLERTKATNAPGLAVEVGLPGLTTARNLMRFARSCGVGGSLGVLFRHAGTAFRLASVVTPQRTILDLARPAAERPDHGIETIHLYPFGGFKRTAGWARALAEGRFRLREDGRKLEVQPE